MIYLDSSVVLARLFCESRSPADAFWSQPFVSSRLLRYEVINRLHVRAIDPVLLEDAGHIVSRIKLIDLIPTVLARALQPFPVAVRTLDGLHLATMDFLRSQGQMVSLASYDQRLLAAAAALGFAMEGL